MSDQNTPYAPPVIVRDRLRRIAKEKGKVIGTDFLDMLEKQVRDTLDEAILYSGERTILRADKYVEHKTLVENSTR